MRKVATKALYLFLCAILGMVLFAMLHRAIFVLYDLLIFTNDMYAFGLSQMSLAIVDFCALLVALFLGGWYGTMMGIDWYAMVYGPNAEVRAGLFHGFIPHNWRGRKDRRKTTSKMTAPATTSTAVKVSSKKETRKQEPEPEEEKAPVREWTFDDLITPKPVAKKKVVRKTAVRKTVRKAASKKVTKTEKVE